MQGVRRFAAILSLVGPSALDSQEAQGQEGGFQVPLNEPMPGTPETPGKFTGLEVQPFGHGRASARWPKPPMRQPKPGEHLGDYLIADQLPSQSLPLGEVRFPQMSVTLPPEPPAWDRGDRRMSWNPECDRPWVPKIGDLPPKPGECLGAYVGEYAVARELPPRYPVPEIKLPTTTVPLPPSFPDQLEIGYRFSSGLSGAAPTTPSASPHRVTVKFSGPCEVNYAKPVAQRGSFYQAAPTIKSCNLVPKEGYRVRLTYTPPGKPTQVFTASMTVALPSSKTEAFVKHSAVPVAFTDEDFAQVNDGKVVVKVIYLPDPDPQDPSLVVSAEEVNSTQLEASLDPIKEASRRGTILATIKIRNVK